MAKKDEMYKCPMCGLVVKVVEAGTCTPCCCGQPMQLITEQKEG